MVWGRGWGFFLHDMDLVKKMQTILLRILLRLLDASFIETGSNTCCQSGSCLNPICPSWPSAANLQIAGSSLGRGDLLGWVLNEKREGLSRRGLGVVLGWWPSGCRCAEGACCSIQCTRVCTPPFCLSHPPLWCSATLVVGDGVGAVQHQKPVQKYHQWATRLSPPCADALTAAQYRGAAANIQQCPTYLHPSPHNCIRLWPMAHVPNA